MRFRTKEDRRSSPWRCHERFRHCFFGNEGPRIMERFAGICLALSMGARQIHEVFLCNRQRIDRDAICTHRKPGEWLGNDLLGRLVYTSMRPARFACSWPNSGQTDGCSERRETGLWRPCLGACASGHQESRKNRKPALPGRGHLQRRRASLDGKLPVGVSC